MKLVGAMSTHEPSDSISKAVNSSIKQVYSLVKQRDHVLLIMLLSLPKLDSIYKKYILFIMHNIHRNVFEMLNIECDNMVVQQVTLSLSVFLWVSSMFMGFLFLVAWLC